MIPHLRGSPQWPAAEAYLRQAIHTLNQRYSPWVCPDRPAGTGPCARLCNRISHLPEWAHMYNRYHPNGDLTAMLPTRQLDPNHGILFMVHR